MSPAEVRQLARRRRAISLINIFIPKFEIIMGKCQPTHLTSFIHQQPPSSSPRFKQKTICFLQPLTAAPAAASSSSRHGAVFVLKVIVTKTPRSSFNTAQDFASRSCSKGFRKSNGLLFCMRRH